MPPPWPSAPPAEPTGAQIPGMVRAGCKKLDGEEFTLTNENRRNALGPILALGTLWCAPAFGQEINGLPDPKAPCAGELGRQHIQTPYDFTTNSLRPRDGFTFEHCVHNNQRGAVDVRWPVPSVNQIVAGNESGITPRYSQKPPLGNRDGCLIYGNLLDRELRAEFWAREEDQKALEGETATASCIAAGRSSTANPNKSDPDKKKGDRTEVKDILAPFRLFLAADPTSPTATLMAFEGVAGVRARTTHSYESFLRYRVRPTEGSKATQLDGYTVSPRWSGEVENLNRFYQVNNQPSAAIVTSRDPVEIHFTVEGTGPWTFDELEYQVRDPKGVVTSVFVPAFIPASKEIDLGGLVAHKSLSLPAAFAIAQAAIKTCASNGYNVSVAVVGRYGEVIVALRGDNTGPHTLENAMKKAYTAQALSRPSGEFAESIKTNLTAGALHLTNIVPAQGALPIKVGAEAIGAVGVSGAPGGEKDEACARASIDSEASDLK
jgi:uncharacterized protein GlcG (DUF336 family)